MPTIVSRRPQKGEDVRQLWQNVKELCDGTNALLNMKAILIEGKARGLGTLRLQGSRAVLQIRAGGAEEFGSGDVTITTPDVVVTSSLNPSNQGQSIRWTATLSERTARGTIQFKIDGTNFGGAVTIVNGVANSAFKSDLHTGNHTILALYSGDPLHNPSSGRMIQHVGGRTDISVLSSANPATPGFAMHWDITVSPHTPGDPRPLGAVDVFIDGVLFESMNLLDLGGGDSGNTTINKIWTIPQAGRHIITTHYRGDSNYAENDFDFNQDVLHTNGILLTVTPNPGVVGQNETFDIQFDVEGGHYPTGNCQMFLSTNGGPFLAFGTPFTLVQGHLSFSGPIAAGHYQTFVHFEGDSFYSAVNSNTVTFDVTAIAQGRVTLVPTPQIVFYDGGLRYIFTVQLDSGQNGSFKLGVVQNPLPNQYGGNAYFYINNVPCPIGFNVFPSIIANFFNGVARCDVAAVLDIPWGGLPNQLIGSNGMLIARADNTTFTSVQGIVNTFLAADYFLLFSRP